MSEYIDNRSHRIRQMKAIIQQLHDGVSPEEVKEQMAQLVRETDAQEIAAMEQLLILEGTPITEIQRMCDLHHQVAKDFLRDPQPIELAPGHPVDTFQRENQALLQTVEAMRAELRGLQSAADGQAVVERVRNLQAHFNQLMDVEKHYQRKENLLFSILERHDIYGPSKVMWGKDDEARAALKALEEAMRGDEDALLTGKDAIRAAAEAALGHVEGMVAKEENVLLPMSMQTLTEDEWGEIWEQSPEYGWCIVEPRVGYHPPLPIAPPDEADIPPQRGIRLDSGHLTPDQLRGLFNVLPLDMTFVDAEDRVRFFSETAERIFPRSKAILGRKVQHCHPPKSVDVVERILDDFRAGRQNVAEFWIELHGKFVHIRYFAIRDEQGTYLGTLEVTQDLTPLRGLQGERRLLQYDAPSN